MNKLDFFIMAMKNKLGHKLEWCIRAFSLITEPEDAWKQKSYPGMIVQHHTGHYYVTEQGTLEKIEDAVPGMPLYAPLEEIDVKPGDLPNIKEPTHTCYGNLLFNAVTVVYAFGDKIPYQSGLVSVEKIRSYISPRLVDDPEVTKAQGKPLPNYKPDAIFVSDYLKFTEGVMYLRGLSQLCVQGATKKVLLPPPGLKEYRAKLVEENKGNLTDLAVIAKIDDALVKYDAAYLKGDPGEKFLLGSKPRAVVRKAKFLQVGASVGMADNATEGVLIDRSLYEGWDMDNFAIMMDTSRSGSFSRGAETQYGGVVVKWLQRATVNLAIGGKDCGTKLGSRTVVKPHDLKRMVGFTIIDNGENIKIENEQQAGAYLGKKILLRNPRYCKLKYTDYCEVCLGDRLSVNPFGLSAAVSALGSTLMGQRMAKMHGRQLATQKLDLTEIIC